MKSSPQLSFRVSQDVFDELEKRGRRSGEGPHQEAKKLLLQAIEAAGAPASGGLTLGVLRAELAGLKESWESLASSRTETLTAPPLEGVLTALERLDDNLKKATAALLVAVGGVSADEATDWVTARLH